MNAGIRTHDQEIECARLANAAQDATPPTEPLPAATPEGEEANNLPVPVLDTSLQAREPDEVARESTRIADCGQQGKPDSQTLAAGNSPSIDEAPLISKKKADEAILEALGDTRCRESRKPQIESNMNIKNIEAQLIELRLQEQSTRRLEALCRLAGGSL